MENTQNKQQEQQRRAEMEKRYQQNKEQIIQRIMRELGLTRNQAETKFLWPL